MAVVTSCERSNRKPTGLFISHNNVTTAVKRDSPRIRKDTHFWKIRAGTKICDFLPLFQTDLNNRSQETNDKKDVQSHGFVSNNRLFNLIHLVQEKNF